MFSKTFTYGLSGIDAYRITIEVHAQKGIPSMTIVGLPDSAVKESRERVWSAIKNSGFDLRPQKITINLSPADTRKEGAGFDLPIALGILAATEHLAVHDLEQFVFLGELSLDGGIRPVRGTLPVALNADQKHFTGFFVPYDNAREAAIAQRLTVYPVQSLEEVIHQLSDPSTRASYNIDTRHLLASAGQPLLDFADVKGQFSVKRGLEVAAAGGHNCLMIGPPGSGKTMLARRIPGILPDMTLQESLETTQIHSVAGLLPSHQPLVTRRPFRCPHHTCSDIALVGGGSHPRPGEVTLAHNGILFLDELPEFSRNALESLRQPLEDHCVTISRASRTVRFPSTFMLVASMNPCPCGFSTDPKRECHCTPLQIQKYVSKISGPLMDRIDIHLDVPALPSRDLLTASEAEPSEAIRRRAAQARTIQHKRLNDRRIFCNAQMGQREIKSFCRLCSDGKKLFERTIEELGLSARAHDKILKVARTIADLSGCETIRPEHLAEAIQYRCLDRT